METLSENNKVRAVVAENATIHSIAKLIKSSKNSVPGGDSTGEVLSKDKKIHLK
jgi:hypothetical protein